jgi:hypothetical protein
LLTLEWSACSEVQARQRYLDKLHSMLPAGAQVVELDSRSPHPPPAARFDAVVALEQPHLKRVARCLRQGGLLAGKRQVTLDGPIQQGWTGAPINFTRVDASDLLELVADAGLQPIWSEVISEVDAGGRPIACLWFIAVKT